MLRTLAYVIVRQDVDRPVRVAIDGPDGAGKTTLADELAPLVQRLGRPAIRASIDGFHRPRAERLLRGDESPEGYYADSFDYDALRSVLLEPLGPGGTRRYRTAVFDQSPIRNTVPTPSWRTPTRLTLAFASGTADHRPR